MELACGICAARPEPYRHLGGCPFHGVHAAAVAVEVVSEAVVAAVIDGASAVAGVVRAVVEALRGAGHVRGSVDEASVLDVDGHLVVGGGVGLFDDVDFAVGGPVGGGGGGPEGGPGAACFGLC